jgi:large subunit ribosomal protein L10
VALKLNDKKAIVEEVAAAATSSVSAIAADYRGLTVAQMTDLRKKARQSGVYLKVVRNTLAKKALQDTSFSCLTDSLSGPLFLAFSKEDPGAAARLLRNAIKEWETLSVKAIALGGQLLGPDSLEQVSNLPTKEEAIALLMSVMKAPVVKLVRTLAESYSRLARVTAQIRDQKPN